MHTGIDLGIKATAIVSIDDNGFPLYKVTFGTAVTHVLKAHTKAHPMKRWKLYHQYFSDYFKEHNIVGTIVMEQPLGNITGNSTKLLELKGVYLIALSDFFEPNKVFLPTPTQIKKFMTGHGGASKEDMIEAAIRDGFRPNNHHEADAFGMARMSFEGVL